jgi:hypothetical protein
MPNIDIENYIEQDRWDYINECNKWEGGGIRNNDEPEQNRMLENYGCNDRIRMMKWQVYFSHLTERALWTIHVMTKRRRIVRERIRETKMTNLKLT